MNADVHFAEVKSKSPPILLVDDDQNLLDALCRQHRKRFELVQACGPEAALAALAAAERTHFAVAVVDYQMPGMDGATLLAEIKVRSPDTVRMMLTGNADQEAAIAAVNKGAIFKYLTKPCPPEIVAAALEAALSEHRARRAERDLLENTLQGAIRVLADVLALVNPQAFGRALRIQQIVRQLARRLQVQDAWAYETAALLSQLGCVAVPSDILLRHAAGQPLSLEQRRVFERHPEVAKDLLGRIPRLEPVVEMVAAQKDRCDQGELPPLGARVLAVALAYDDLVARGTAPAEAIQRLRWRKGELDGELLDLLHDVEPPGRALSLCTLEVAALAEGMTLDEDLFLKGGALLLPRGHEVSAGTVLRLRSYVEAGAIAKQVRVRAPVGAEA